MKRSSRDRLVRAAAELFYDGGIHRTTVDAIADNAGVTNPTLYRHFPSKDQLIEAALQLRDREHRERLGDLRGPSTTIQIPEKSRRVCAESRRASDVGSPRKVLQLGTTPSSPGERK